MRAYSPQPRLDYRLLWHHWWYVPLLMVFISYAWFFSILSVVHLLFKTPPLELVSYHAQGLTWLFGVLGLVLGLKLVFSARKDFDRGLSVDYLGLSHPLTQRVHRLADQLNLPHPKVGTMWVSNAYAAGSTVGNAVVVVGRPLINGLTSEELDAIIGHELGHIACGDVQRMQFAVGYQQLYLRFLEITGKGLHFSASQASQSSGRGAQESELALTLMAAVAFIPVLHRVPCF